MTQIEEYRPLRQGVIEARLARELTNWALKIEEARAITRFLESQGLTSYGQIGRNEEERELCRRMLLNDDIGYQRALREARDAERRVMENDADLDTWLEARRFEREDLTRQQLMRGDEIAADHR